MTLSPEHYEALLRVAQSAREGVHLKRLVSGSYGHLSDLAEQLAALDRVSASRTQTPSEKELR